MGFTEKIDVLDLVINVLNEHERKLDQLVERLEIIVEFMQTHPDFGDAFIEFEEQLDEIIEYNGTVLIVDDDEFLAETFKMVLEDSGFLVETAHTGSQALLKASQTDFDLAILDLKLPDTTGNDLARLLKERKTDLNVILLTGQTEMLDSIAEADLRSDEVLLKPISPDELLKITEKLSAKE
jgi:CheY-like chemotaxis protein